MAINIIKEPNPKPGTLGRKELFALAIGQVIGAGVVTLIVPAIKMTGYSAWLAYLVAIICGFILIAPWVWVTSTLRLGGGNYSMLCDLAGPTASGMFSFMYLAQCLMLALFCTSAAAYLGDLIPALGSETGRKITGIVLLTFFLIVNLLGVDIMARIQKLMVWLLIAALVVFAVIGIFHLELPIFNFADPNFMVNGPGIKFENGQITGGFMGAMLLFIYSTFGYYMVSGYGKDAKNAKKDIPVAMLLCIPTLIVCYIGVAIAGVGTMSLEEYGTSTTLVFTAKKLMPAALFYAFIIAGPIMALLSTLNSSMSYTAVMIGSSCDDGWLPKKLGAQNSRGARYWILAIVYIVNVVPMAFGWSITTLTNMIQLVMSSYTVLNFFAFIHLPAKYPESWKKSRFHVSDKVYLTMCVLSLIMAAIVIWKSLLSMTRPLAIGAAAFLIFGVIMGIVRAKTGNIEIHTSVWDDDM